MAAMTTSPSSDRTRSQPTPDADNPRAPAAVLWDFDGTLVDTEPVWMRAEYRLVEALGGRWSEADCHNMVGNSLLDSGAYVVARLREQGITDAHIDDDAAPTPLTAEWVVDRLVAEVLVEVQTSPIPWRPGAEQLLTELAEAGVTQALVSASYRSQLDAVVDRLPEGSFSAVIAGDAVTHGKPHPEPYLTACDLLGVDPGQCVALEDSLPGCESGNAAGCVVIAIHNLVDIPPAPRRVRIASLAGVGAGKLAELFQRGCR